MLIAQINVMNTIIIIAMIATMFRTVLPLINPALMPIIGFINVTEPTRS